MALHYAQKIKKVGFGEKTEATVETVQRNTTVSAQELIRQIHLNTLLPKGVIESVLNALCESLQTYLLQGHSAYIGRSGKEEEGLGIIYPRLIKKKEPVYKYDPETGKMQHDSDGNPVIERMKTNLSVGVGLRPSTALKAVLASVSVKDVTPSDNDNDEDDNTGTDNNTQQPGTGGGTTPPSLD